jgi:lipid II:glycine glycyltransferase (peptidoglycan interpeptide bridge formation enzyme)
VEAIKDDQVISSKLIVIYGKVAHSLLSGTDDEGRKLRVPSLVQWEAMKEAMKRSCNRYSIGGASSSDRDYPSIKKVTKYKEGFGGHVIVHNDIYDIVYDQTSYLAYNTYKRLRSLISRD